MHWKPGTASSVLNTADGLETELLPMERIFFTSYLLQMRRVFVCPVVAEQRVYISQYNERGSILGEDLEATACWLVNNLVTEQRHVSCVHGNSWARSLHWMKTHWRLAPNKVWYQVRKVSHLRVWLTQAKFCYLHCSFWGHLARRATPSSASVANSQLWGMRAGQSSSLLPTINQHGRYWHRAPKAWES
jgi:hypothetical protein